MNSHIDDVSFDMLRLYERIAETGSLTAAARELGISPSTATRKLAALEATLSVRLFQRTTRKMLLSEAGATALSWARHALAEADSTSDDLASITGAPTGRIRLAVNHYVANTYLPKLLAKFCLTYPSVTITLSATDRFVDLVEERYDVALHSGVIPQSRLIGIRIASIKRILCAAPSYIERFGQPDTIADLVSHRCLVHFGNEQECWYFHGGGKAPIAQFIRPVFESDNYLVLKRLAILGVGIAQLSETMIAAQLATGQLVALLPQYECVSSNGEAPDIWLLYQDRKPLHRVRLLIDFLRREIPLARFDVD